MTWSRLVPLVAAVIPGIAQAAACCVGSTSPFPIRVGECEHGVVGLALGAEAAFARWDRHGALASPGVADQALTASVGAALRFDRRLQASVILPARLSHREGVDAAGWGGGIGDVTAQLLWDPLEERFDGPPTPLFTLGVRAPTGRDWTESRTVLLEDVTGQPEPALLVGVQLDRSLGRTPLNVALDHALGFGVDGLRPSFALSGSVGRYLGTDWSVLGTASYLVSWASLSGSSGMVARPRVGARIVRGERMAWRAWAGVDADVPVPGLGRSSEALITASGGFALVR